MSLPQFLTMKEACQYRRCSRNTMYRHIENGLPYIRDRGTILFYIKDLEKDILKGRIGGAA